MARPADGGPPIVVDKLTAAVKYDGPFPTAWVQEQDESLRWRYVFVTPSDRAIRSAR